MANQKTESEPEKSAVVTSEKFNDGSDSLDDAHPQRVFDPAKLLLLFNASKALASATNLDQLLDIVIGEVQKVIECDGSGVLLYDEVRDDFYWRLVKDEQSFLSSAMDEIRIPRDRGVCGWVFTTGEPALVHDAANDPRIYKEVDQKSGFQTRNMVCTPLQTREKKLGVLYALNKTNGSFTEDDVEILSALASNVALALESASYLERLTNSNLELQRLNRAKDKMLNHLSHELKTPLAIIEASLSIVKRRLEKIGIDFNSLPFERIDRNFDRLRTIEKQLVHIVEGKDYPEKLIIVRFLDHLEEFLEIEQSESPEFQDALESLRRRILTLFPAKIEETDSTDLAKLLDSERI
ncbi:MAG: GAF domain-containing protein, partial [Desulfomonilaceae bacterium]